MKKIAALLFATTLSASTLLACTPKPVAAEPTAADFLAALASHDVAAAADFSDDPSTAAAALNASWEGLQAESLDTHVMGVVTQDNRATATAELTWHLPRDRQLSYQTQILLTKAQDTWTIHWQPTVIHPELGANQHLELRAVTAERASVVSSDGVAVLTPGKVYRLLVDTTELPNPGEVATTITAALEKIHATDEDVPTVDAAELERNLRTASGTYSVAVFSERQGLAVATALSGISSVRLNEEAAMVTPNPDFAPDIMSRVRTIVDADLDGTNGWEVDTVTADGVVFDTVDYHAAQPAPAISISIDYEVQLAAQEAVNQRADSEAMLVAIRPSTGEILAIAQTEAADAKGDLALMGQYPPGSTFKMITAAAGIQDQGLNATSAVGCPGTLNILGRVVTNYDAFSLGTTSLENAFAQSCNTTFAQISTDLAPGELQQMAKSFGLGIDYDIPGLETLTGSVPTGDIDLDRTEAGYGQGLDLASPFGLALVAATVANGFTPTPTLIANHETTATEQVPAPDPATIEQLRTLMRAVVTSGTARGMTQTGGDLYGKTGEAEINEGSHAWFAGYRSDDIAFATLVPLGGGSEVSVALTDAFFTNLDALRAGTSAGLP